MIERVGELDAAARDPGVVASGECQLGIFGERGAGLVDAAAGDRDETGQDQRLCLRAAFGEPLLDEQLIGPALRHGDRL